MKYFFIAVIVSLFICSCEKDSTINSAGLSYTGYFPLDSGTWITYTVDSVVHLPDDDLTNVPDTSITAYHFQIKEVIESGFIDGQGNLAYHVSRYKRLNDTLPWDFQSVWVATRTYNSAQRVEDNIRYVKLSFPPDMQASWDGNAFNTFGEEDYSYASVHSSLSVGTYVFDSSVTVLQSQDNNAIHRILKEEKYANHVGMVYKQKDSLNIRMINNIVQVTNGVEYKETVKSYGH